MPLAPVGYKEKLNQNNLGVLLLKTDKDYELVYE